MSDSVVLHKNKVVKKSVAYAFPWMVISLLIIVVITVAIIASGGVLVWLAPTIPAVIFMMILILCVNLLYQRWYYDFYHFSLHPNYLLIRKNPLKPHEVTIAYERIHDMTVDQDFFDKIFGLYDLHINRGGSKKHTIHIDGLAKKAAEELRTQIHEKIQQHTLRHLPIQPPKILGQR